MLAPAFLASVGTQVNVPPFPPFWVLGVIFGFFVVGGFFVLFFFFALGPCQTVELIGSTFGLPCTSPRQPLGGLYGLRNHF